MKNSEFIAEIKSLITGEMSPRLSSRDRMRVLAINLFGIGIILTCLVYAVIFNRMEEPMLFRIVVFLSLICAAPMVLNFTGYYSIARFLFTFQAPIFILFYTSVLGSDFGFQYFFILAFAFPFVFLKPDERGKAIAFFFYNAVCLVLYEYGNFDWIPTINLSQNLEQILRVSVLVVFFLLALVLFLTFHKLIIRNEEKMVQSHKEIEKAYRVRQDFLAMMSHELRTPLNAVVTITAILDENPNHPENAKFLKILRQSSNNLLSIINDILDFTKLEAQSLKIQARPQLIRNVMEELADTYRTVANEKGLLLELNIDRQINANYEFDDVKLRQILSNLISNAIKFTNSGTIQINLTKLESQGVFDELQFEVIDNGQGISEQDMQKIFDSFSQLKSVLTRNTGGTGLGLAIVKRLLDLHESDISVESQLGKGSRFYFKLRLKSTRKLETPENQAFEKIQKKKILLVEDNAVNAMVAEKLLQNWGVEVTKASNGEIALQCCQNDQFHLILMDLHMPVIDGYEAASRIRNSETPNKFIPIVALTADVTGDENEAYEKYFDGFLTKPIQKEKLQHMLTEKL